MIGASAASWSAALPIGAVAVLVLVLPGWVAAWVVGVRGFAALAVGPAVSVATITLGGVAASVLGIGWRPVTLLGAVLVTWLVALGVGVLLRRAGGYEGRRRRPGMRPDVGELATPGIVTARGGLRSLVGEWLWPLVGVAVAAVGLAAAFLPVAGHPSSFPQQPDAGFHLSTVQWMLDRQDISSLHAAGFSSLDGGGFYPAGFHGIVVSVVQLCALVGIGGATPVVGATMVSLATAAFVWPAGCLLLARIVLGRGATVALATGVAATAFSAFPLWLMGFGVLWPNLLGYSLMPAALACLLVALRPSGPVHATAPLASGEAAPDERLHWRRPHAVVLLAAGLPGVALAHPNAVVSLGVLGLPLLIEAVLARAWDRRHQPRAALRLVGGLIAVLAVLAAGYVLATQRMTSMRAATPLGREMSPLSALREAVLQAPRGAPPLPVLGAIVIIGALVLLWRRPAGHQPRRWVVAALLLTTALWVMVVGIDDETTRWFTWPWYNSPPRPAALMVLPGVLCAAAALALPARAVLRWSGRRHASPPTSAPRWVVGVAAVLAALVPAGFVVATDGYVAEHREMIDRYWHPSKYRSWASDGELKALRRLSQRIGPEDVTAANPWNGATYLYLVSGRRMLFPTEKARSAGDRALLADRLADVGTEPEVCAAARRQHVRFAITGGRPFASGGTDWTTYPGIDAVPTSDAFARVATAGPYTLWRLTSCAGA